MPRKLKVDFTDVESYSKAEEGEHIAVLRELEETEAKESGNDMIVAKFEVIKGESKGAIVYDRYVLVEKALFRFKNFLEAVGMKADGKIQVDLDKLIGKKVIIDVKHEEYNGQERAKIDAYKALSAKAAQSAKDAEDDEDEDDIEDDEEEETPPPKKKKPAAPAPDLKKKKKPAPEPEEEEEDEDEEEEEEEPAPKKKKPSAPPAKKPTKPVKKKKPADEDEEDEDDWEDD